MAAAAAGPATAQRCALSLPCCFFLPSSLPFLGSRALLKSWFSWQVFPELLRRSHRRGPPGGVGGERTGPGLPDAWRGPRPTRGLLGTRLPGPRRPLLRCLSPGVDSLRLFFLRYRGARLPRTSVLAPSRSETVCASSQPLRKASSFYVVDVHSRPGKIFLLNDVTRRKSKIWA